MKLCERMREGRIQKWKSGEKVKSDTKRRRWWWVKQLIIGRKRRSGLNKQLKATADTHEMNFGDERNRLNLMQTHPFTRVCPHSQTHTHTHTFIRMFIHSN